MARFAQTQGGMYWLARAWAQLKRHPGLFCGMGLLCMLAFALVGIVPLLGGLLVALCAPILLAGAYMAIDKLESSPIDAPQRFAHAPRALLGALREEDNTVAILAAAVYCMLCAVLIHLLMWLVVGDAWTHDWAALDAVGRISVAFGAVFSLALYFIVAATLIYALPLTLLRNELLVPAMRRSIGASMRHLPSVALVLALAWLPFALGRLASLLSPGLGYAIAIGVGTVALPVAAIALHASYRALFCAEPQVVDAKFSELARTP